MSDARAVALTTENYHLAYRGARGEAVACLNLATLVERRWHESDLADDSWLKVEEIVKGYRDALYARSHSQLRGNKSHPPAPRIEPVIDQILAVFGLESFPG